MKSKRILYLTYDGLTDNLGRSQIIPYLNGLISHLDSIHVISFDKAGKFRKRENQVRKSLHAHVEWTSLTYHRNPPLLSTLHDLWQLKRKIESLFRISHFDLIHVRSYPPMGAALWARKKYKCKVLFDMRGFYVDERMEGGIWSKKNPVHRLLYQRLKKKEKAYFKESDAIISLTRTGKKILNQQFNIPEDKVTVIPCCADFEHFTPIDSVKNDDRLQIVYLGSLGTWYLTEELLEAFREIKETFEDSQLTILSHDEAHEVFEVAKRLQLPQNSIEVKGCEKEDLPTELCKADVSIFFIRTSFSKQASSPTKLGELLASGIPVIANSGVGDLHFHEEELTGLKLIDTSNIPTTDWKGIITELLMADTAEIRQKAKEYFSVEVGIKRYKSAYKSILAKN